MTNFYNLNGKAKFLKNEKPDFTKLKNEREYLLHLINIKSNKLKITKDIAEIKNISNEVYSISRKIQELDKKLFFFIEY